LVTELRPVEETRKRKLVPIVDISKSYQYAATLRFFPDVLTIKHVSKTLACTETGVMSIIYPVMLILRRSNENPTE
jgi:hypothetical protein